MNDPAPPCYPPPFYSLLSTLYFPLSTLLDPLMKIIRYADPAGKIQYAERRNEGATNRDLEIEGDLFGSYRVTDRPAKVSKLLAPVEPRAFLCIGLNYRKHAEEGKSPIPKWPVLFMKSPGAVQNPGD